MLRRFLKLFDHYPYNIWLAELGAWGGTVLLPVVAGGLFWAGLPVLATGVLLVWGLLVYAAWGEPRQLIRTEFALTDEALPPLKLVLVSDLHVGPYKKKAWVEHVVRALNDEADVDAVLLLGDFVFHPHCEAIACLEPLKELKAPAYAVTGNHDHEPDPSGTHAERLVAQLQQWGITVLQNESASALGARVAGVMDNHSAQHNLAAALGQGHDAPVILMAHSPDIIPEVAAHPQVRLVVSGHTHGGQIRLPAVGAVPGVLPVKSTEYDRGHFAVGGQQLVVSSGAGETGVRLRFLCPPEYVVVTINK